MDIRKQSIVILILVIIVSVIIYFFISSENGNSVSISSVGGKESEITNEKTYESEVNYRVPKGNEIINVEVTLIEKKIIDVSTTHSRFSNHNTPYMDDFDNNYESEVIGKNIDEVDLGSVAGASVTTEAFMTALGDIKQQI